MDINVCVGSSCHLRGSYEIINLFKTRLEENGLTDKVNFGGAFCFGRCTGTGVTIKIDDEIISGVTKENFDTIFDQYVLQK